MPKRKRSNRKSTNPDFRARTQVPAPPAEDIAQRLRSMLTPAVFAPLRSCAAKDRVKLRDRLLTLPVMVAIVVSIVWRQVPSLTELLRVLALEGLLWVGTVSVSKQALSKRLAKLPASLFADIFSQSLAHLEPLPVDEKNELSGVAARFTVIWLADGSTLEALRKKLKETREETQSPLGGKMMVVVEALTRRTVKAFYNCEPNANDKLYSDQVIEALPVKGLLVYDLGFFSFQLFDKMTQEEKFFVTRQREKTQYRVVEVLGQGPYYKDEIIEMGKYRSNPCRESVRMVSVQWKGVWHRYLTNVIDSKRLSAREVCEIYQRRWRIEEAFLLTKRLLGLSYLWVGGKNGVEVQVYATLIFYTVLTDLTAEVAKALGEAIEKISVEMVFRSLYHYSRAIERGEKVELIGFLAAHAKLFGLVKAKRKRHRELDSNNILVWGEP
jgi:hypothetical protein